MWGICNEPFLTLKGQHFSAQGNALTNPIQLYLPAPPAILPIIVALGLCDVC